MKNILLLLILFCLPIYNTAQPFGDAATNFRIVKQNYENSSGEKGCTHFKYDIEGKLYKALWILDNKSRSSANYYEYDATGNLVSAFREFSDGLTSYELFRYDTNGNKTSEQFYRSDSVSGGATYHYENGILIRVEFKRHKGWLNGTMLFLYNGKNKKKDAELLINDKAACQISYEYDDYDNLVKENWNFNDKWSQTFRYFYERTDLNKNFYSSPLLTPPAQFRISKENYTLNDEIGGPSIYHYDENGLLYKKEFIRSDGVSTTTFYEYDTDRRLVLSKRNYSDGRDAHFTYDYDENDNLILRSFYVGDSLAGFESYFYNSEGDLIKSYLKNFDNWLTGIVTYRLDVLGKIQTGEFKGENGFDASVNFTYNTEGLLSKIIWKFSFGKFQKYNFEYELIE